MNNSISVKTIQVLKASLLDDYPCIYIARHKSHAWDNLLIYKGDSEYFSDLTPIEEFTFILLVLESETS